ncbi:hypothetical protein ACHAXS_006490 [Conticribra weissflogii]
MSSQHRQQSRRFPVPTSNGFQDPNSSLPQGVPPLPKSFYEDPSFVTTSTNSGGRRSISSVCSSNPNAPRHMSDRSQDDSGRPSFTGNTLHRNSGPNAPTTAGVPLKRRSSSCDDLPFNPPNRGVFNPNNFSTSFQRRSDSGGGRGFGGNNFGRGRGMNRGMSYNDFRNAAGNGTSFTLRQNRQRNAAFSSAVFPRGEVPLNIGGPPATELPRRRSMDAEAPSMFVDGNRFGKLDENKSFRIPRNNNVNNYNTGNSFSNGDISSSNSKKHNVVNNQGERLYTSMRDIRANYVPIQSSRNLTNFNKTVNNFNSGSSVTPSVASNTAEIIARRKRQRQMESLGISTRAVFNPPSKALKPQEQRSFGDDQGFITIPLGSEMGRLESGDLENNLTESSKQNQIGISSSATAMKTMRRKSSGCSSGGYFLGKSAAPSEYSAVPSNRGKQNSHGEKSGSSGGVIRRIASVTLFSSPLKKEKAKEPNWKSSSTNKIIAGLVLVLLLAGGAIGIILFVDFGAKTSSGGTVGVSAGNNIVNTVDGNITAKEGGNFTAKDGSNSTENVVNDSNLAPSSTPDPKAVTIVEPPPKDIEGRCSPSNLPGSISVCLAACLPSACCYSDYSGKLCFHESNSDSMRACEKYRPYCDVFYDPWPGAPEGVLRGLPDDIDEVCGGGLNATVLDANFSSTIEVPSDEMNRTSPPLAAADLNIANNAEMSSSGAAAAQDVTVTGNISRDSIEQSNSTEHDKKTNLFGGELMLCGRNSGKSYNADIKRKRNWIHMENRFLSEDHLSVGQNYTTSPEIITTFPVDSSGSSPQCKEICTIAKCCFAPVILYPYASGLILSSSGVYTNSTTGEHVVTSCAESSKNKELCEKYTKHCANVTNSTNFVPPQPIESAWTSRPTTSSTDQPIISLNNTSSSVTVTVLSPSPSTSYSPTNLASPSSAPTMTSNPTASVEPSLFPSSSVNPTISPAPSQSTQPIEANNIPMWAPLPPSKTQVPTTAAPSLEFQVDNATILNTTNETLIIQDGNYTTDNITTTTAPTSDAIDSNVPPIPEKNLLEVCSDDSISSLSGITECIELCTLGACCGAIDLEENCFLENKAICGLYNICSDAASAYNQLVQTSLSSKMPPSPPANLATLCSYETMEMAKLAGTISGCSPMCEPGICCLENNCFEGIDVEINKQTMWTLEQRCAMFEPCKNLIELPPPPVNISDTCDGNNPESEECSNICSSISCCFPSSFPLSNYSSNDDEITPELQESCYSYFEDTCKAYAPYCDLYYKPPLPPPPSDLTSLCALGSDTFCNEACKVAKCCFEVDPLESCLDYNEEICGKYYPCAELYI